MTLLERLRNFFGPTDSMPKILDEHIHYCPECTEGAPNAVWHVERFDDNELRYQCPGCSTWVLAETYQQYRLDRIKAWNQEQNEDS